MTSSLLLYRSHKGMGVPLLQLLIFLLLLFLLFPLRLLR
jgi:hypothetical protein